MAIMLRCYKKKKKNRLSSKEKLNQKSLYGVSLLLIYIYIYIYIPTKLKFQPPPLVVTAYVLPSLDVLF